MLCAVAKLDGEPIRSFAWLCLKALGLQQRDEEIDAKRDGYDEAEDRLEH